jgi:hypothetical protein
MKRLAFALALAASVLVAGCTPTCDSRDVEVTWSGFDGPATGQAGRDCLAANVPYVGLYLNGQQVVGPSANGLFPCTDYGEVIGGVPNDNELLTIEGVGSDGVTIMFRQQVPFSGTGCNDLILSDAVPAAGTAQIQYAFQSGSACASGTSYMWFTIFDLVANANDTSTIDASSSLTAQTTWQCGPTDPVINLPAGQYQLAAMTEMIENSPTAFTQAAYLCQAPVSFSVFDPVTDSTLTLVTPSLADTGSTCAP